MDSSFFVKITICILSRKERTHISIKWTPRTLKPSCGFLVLSPPVKPVLKLQLSELRPLLLPYSCVGLECKFGTLSSLIKRLSSHPVIDYNNYRTRGRNLNGFTETVTHPITNTGTCCCLRLRYFSSNCISLNYFSSNYFSSNDTSSNYFSSNCFSSNGYFSSNYFSSNGYFSSNFVIVRFFWEWKPKKGTSNDAENVFQYLFWSWSYCNFVSCTCIN